ncbi:RAD51-associated protein 1 [Fukomys damarensis]|uniref:RAD51-associated protein 1 n=1 Tax=Fukomys damarensis TaxID=885580 RepID=A0A091D8K6_FUKDA|nr:RAD51-associated protein 1 [Fukomys damarensis]
MTFDVKIFQRGLEAALALSVRDRPVVTNDVQRSQDKRVEKYGKNKTEIMNKSLHISNCSIAADYLDLDQISEEGDSSSEASENDSDVDESKDNEEDFTVQKSRVKENKKKKVKVKSPVEKKEKKSKSKCNALVSAGDSSPATVKSESQSSPKQVSSSEARRRPLQIHRPSAKIKRRKWVPPSASGSSSHNSSPLGGMATAKSPVSLRLGLSRLAQVKPLYPNATSSRVW